MKLTKRLERVLKDLDLMKDEIEVAAKDKELLVEKVDAMRAKKVVKSTLHQLRLQYYVILACDTI